MSVSDFDTDDQDDDQTRDKPLSFHWRALNQEWIQELDLPPAPSARHDKTRASIITEAYRLGRVEPDRMISYSRRKSFYTDQQRYRGTEYAYSTVPWAVDDLEKRGLIENDRAKPGRRGLQSTFKATTALIEAVKVPLVVSYDPLETIRLKNTDKQLVNYRDTEFTEKARRNVAAINEATRSAKIDFAHGLNTMAKNGEGIYEFTKDDGQRVRIDFNQDQYHRVFNNGRFTLGGRFYGPAWQSTPKVARDHITIDGERTKEPDYKGHHARILYETEGKQRPDGDIYEIDGFDRDILKRAFNIMLNADTDRAAMSAIAEKIGGQGSYAKAMAVMEAVKKRHTPVAQYFCTGAGRWLQRSDSNMAEGVLLAALNHNIVALCIHDSFRVQERHEGRILEFMDEQFAREIRRLNPDARSSTYVQKVPHMEVVLPSTLSPDRGSLPFYILLPPVRQLDLFEPEKPVGLHAGDFLSWEHGLLPESFKGGLRHALERKGLRHEDVANKIGISRPQFVNALQGRFGVSAPVADRIKDFLYEAAMAA